MRRKGQIKGAAVFWVVSALNLWKDGNNLKKICELEDNAFNYIHEKQLVKRSEKGVAMGIFSKF